MNKINDFLKQTRNIQQQIAALKNDLEKKEMEILSGGGMIRIKITGKQEILDLQLDRKCIDPQNKEELEKLIKEAVNEAIGESQKMVSNAMSEMGSLG